jgi:hypothetical protein
LGWVVAASRKRGAFGKGGRVAGWPGSRVADLYHFAGAWFVSSLFSYEI